MNRLLFIPVFLSLLAGCDTTRKVTLDPAISIRIEQRLLIEQPRFEPRTATTLTEAELLFEYTRLSNAYTQCYNDHNALSTLLKEINKP